MQLRNQLTDHNQKRCLFGSTPEEMEEERQDALEMDKEKKTQT